MRTLKGWITTTCLVATLMVSTATANTGVIIAGRNQPAPVPCTEPGKDDVKYDVGVIIAGIGVIIAGFTGVIIAGAVDEGPIDCGVIIAG
jgi:hypothetical protein